jgi:hypothetical protein
MSVDLEAIRGILLPRINALLRMTPEEREEDRRLEAEALAKEGAAETAYYDSLSPEERTEYDRMTRSMLPRLGV